MIDCGYKMTNQNIHCFMVEFDPGIDGTPPIFRDQQGQPLDPVPPGAMYWMHRKIWCVVHHVPCSHLCVVTPGGNVWDIDSIGCQRFYPHNCWIRHGDPPNVTDDKDGQTCDAGRGSFGGNGCHVFLCDGEFIDLDRQDADYFYSLRREHRAKM